ncbi:MAG TPA: ATP-binding protein [Longimicrobiaceae bacterium]|nr:ATP-binding protein [Longimicrobiaceae bacterium]
MTPASRDSSEADDLLGRVSRAQDLPEALWIFFESVLIEAGIERSLVLVEREKELRGVLGVGWNPDAARAVTIELEAGENKLADAYAAGEPTFVEYQNDGRGIESGKYLTYPIPTGVPDPSAFALLIIGPDDTGSEAQPEIVRALRRIGPLLRILDERDALRQSGSQTEHQRDLLTSLVNALPDPVLITDAENSILLENRRAEGLFSTTEGDSEGRRRAVEINNLVFSSFLTRSAFGGADPSARELNLVDPSEGGDLLFEILSTSLPNPLMGDSATVSVLRDVTDLKRATTELEHQFKRVRQAELKSSRERDRLNLILENVGDPILVTDDQSNIILMNREAERLFDIPPGTDLQSRRRQEVRANDTKFSSFISEFALSADSARVVEFQLTDPDTRRRFPAEVVSGKVVNERSEMAAIISVVHDLTKVVENERLAAELSELNEDLEDRVRTATAELEERNDQLEWQSRELERAYRLKSQFLASMSHELRTPINALLGYTSLMRDQIYGELTERQNEALGRMYMASQHLLELVNDILDLAKIEAGKMPVHIEAVNVGTLIRELSQTVEPMVRRKKLEYRVDVEDDIPVLETDRTKIKQILLNLLSNAIKFTHEGHVSVSARTLPNGQGVEITTSDSGIGIRDENIPKIFEDFRQVDQSSTREYGGTGLGLSITKKLLHLLGGTIEVESKLGEGSTFTLRLPIRSEEIVLDKEVSRAARDADDAVVNKSETG